ncbi:MAG: hypothetical protein AAF959_10865 [Cyanobacteria bacterium P01_D01_bin.56]
MSLIHLEKSVVSFHFRELLEDGHTSHQLALVGLGMMLLGPKLLPAIAKASRPMAKQLVKSSYSYRPQLTLNEWVKQSRQVQSVTSEHLTKGVTESRVV